MFIVYCLLQLFIGILFIVSNRDTTIIRQMNQDRNYSGFTAVLINILCRLVTESNLFSCREGFLLVCFQAIQLFKLFLSFVSFIAK